MLLFFIYLLLIEFFIILFILEKYTLNK